ncbi:acetate/propionate family kinase [Pseudosulfitobacter koreensis]|uniref:Acetate kinase n=1 Tax=Pseudosulfitobacter koreensis TaxID=2968472 RepID=A0ABT1YW28_9RHOB|nr:acetate/propionate family kinase [Pseudosulfitobacter koreense]MCR8825093.1 acetate/propionate family kinase [Pseudosulfitobacter koreense]
MARAHILVINAGSSSIKAALFDTDLHEVLRIEATGIGGAGEVRSGDSRSETPLPDHKAALGAIFDALAAQGIDATDLRAVAHRVVHGGPELTASARITPQVRAAIADAVPLAPLHNPHHLAAIDAVAKLMPDLPQCATFDTAFHATNPDVARRYAVPDVPETDGLQRYGFHGTSFAALVKGFEETTGTPLPRRLLALHLGNGASLCAIREGQSVATTMGFSPLSGLTMGTRAGEIDAGAVLHLVEVMGAEAASEMLYHDSGLLGLSGISSDMRTLTASDDPRARFAREHFCYWIARQSGSMIAAMQGLDGIVFTGGIGENDADIRNNVLAQLSWLGNIPHWVIPAAEEQQIARDAITLLKDHRLAP